MRAWVLVVGTTTTTGLRVSTFNCLAPVHKSAEECVEGMCVEDRREADDPDLWLPRAEKVVDLIGELKADVVCVQEFWWEPRWLELFEKVPGYELATARRKGLHPHDGSARSDGVATLVSRRGLDVDEARVVDLSGGRVALAVAVSFRGKRVVVGNVHLPFPSSGKARSDQVAHATHVAEIVETMRPDLGIIVGDMNARAYEDAPLALEDAGYTNCAKAFAAMSLGSGCGGVTDIGVTHRTHLGNDIQCDHIFARDFPQPGPSAALGYFDNAGAALSCVARYDILTTPHLPAGGGTTTWDPNFNVSDHLPVSATFDFDASGGGPRARAAASSTSAAAGGRGGGTSQEDVAWEGLPWPDTIR